MQRRIEETIQAENIHANMEAAMENHPELFNKVDMLYINCEVNKRKVKAFVDSGAQATISKAPVTSSLSLRMPLVSPRCAEMCGILHLIDKRFAGEARGVGTAKILGRIHSAEIKLGDLHLSCSFMIMEGKGKSAACNDQ